MSNSMSGNLKVLIEDYVRTNVFTSMPAKVVSIAKLNSHQQVSVQPLTAIKFGDGAAISLPQIDSVPVVFSGGGGAMFSYPIKVDDVVLLVFCMRSLDEWKHGDGLDVVVPTSNRFYNINDAVAIPGLFTAGAAKAPSTDNVELRFNDMAFSLTKTGDIVMGNGAGSITLQADGTVNINGVTIDTSGNIVSNGVDYLTHVHTGVQTGGGSTGGPI